MTAGSLSATLTALQYNRQVNSVSLEHLLADSLVGKQWPIDSSFHEKLEQTASGKWLIIVARNDCSHCREMLRTHFADPRRHRKGERTAIFLVDGERWEFSLDFVSLDRKFADEVDWHGDQPFVASPAVFVLSDGEVVIAADGADSEALMNGILGQE
ncbi:hypothetical protein N9N28_15195 [Rubripirellula amarantea]|nr:hypothetical protein [Rubripirellula amarantea]